MFVTQLPFFYSTVRRLCQFIIKLDWYKARFLLLLDM